MVTQRYEKLDEILTQYFEVWIVWIHISNNFLTKFENCDTTWFAISDAPKSNFPVKLFLLLSSIFQGQNSKKSVNSNISFQTQNIYQFQSRLRTQFFFSFCTSLTGILKYISATGKSASKERFSKFKRNFDKSDEITVVGPHDGSGWEFKKM